MLRRKVGPTPAFTRGHAGITAGDSAGACGPAMAVAIDVERKPERLAKKFGRQHILDVALGDDDAAA